VTGGSGSVLRWRIGEFDPRSALRARDGVVRGIGGWCSARIGAHSIVGEMESGERLWNELAFCE
jgi:hypothetical protein